VRKSVAVTGPCGFPRGVTTGETGAAGGPQTVITVVAVFGVAPLVANVNVIVEGPGAVEEDAWNENAADANAGGASAADVGVTVIPGGSPDGVTVTSEVGAQLPATSDAVSVAAAPPAFRVTAGGAAAGVKAGGRTFATKVVEELMPRGSLTSAVSVVGPGGVPGAAVTVKSTVRAGGIERTGIVAGATVSPSGRFGNVTVGVPE
jgi:hypothetical protein